MYVYIKIYILMLWGQHWQIHSPSAQHCVRTNMSRVQLCVLAVVADCVSGRGLPPAV